MVTTTWKAGSAQEIAFGIIANHGGGASARLCKRKPGTKWDGLTEECFQAGALDFVGSTSWVQYGENRTSRVPIPAMRTNTGTVPEGSMWTKNPVSTGTGGRGC